MNLLKVHPKAYLKIYVFIGIIVFLALVKLIIAIIIYSISSKKIKKFEENDPDIIITGLSSIKFLEKRNPEEYIISAPNLGSTGKIIFDCFRGQCAFQKLSTCTRTECTEKNRKTKCRIVNYYCYKDYYKYIYNCSYECRTKEKLTCNSCPSNATNLTGNCSRKENDDYDTQKSCLADNVIYNWNGFYYDRTNGTINGEITYLKNAVQANESCPSSMKMCGILDELGNKLCIPKADACPINYIKISDYNDYKYNYIISNIGNKKLYYTNEAVSEKIIGGLYVDSDLLIQYKNEECEILDTGSISELINDNKILYKNVLKFDPYSEKNIDNMGKSYLKWCIVGQGRNKDLNFMKKENISFSLNKTINEHSIPSILNYVKPHLIFSILGSTLMQIFFIIFLFAFFSVNEVGFNLCCCFSDEGLFVFLTLSLFIFFFTSLFFNLFTIIVSSSNVDYLIEMKKTNKSFINSLIVLNRMYFWINIIMNIIIIISAIYLFKAPKKDKTFDYNTKNNKTGNSDFPDFDINNNTSSNTNNNNNSPYYNMDYKNNSNNGNVGYNSADYNNGIN